MLGRRTKWEYFLTLMIPVLPIASPIRICRLNGIINRVFIAARAMFICLMSTKDASSNLVYRHNITSLQIISWRLGYMAHFHILCFIFNDSLNWIRHCDWCLYGWSWQGAKKCIFLYVQAVIAQKWHYFWFPISGRICDFSKNHVMTAK